MPVIKCLTAMAAMTARAVIQNPASTVMTARPSSQYGRIARSVERFGDSGGLGAKQ